MKKADTKPGGKHDIKSDIYAYVSKSRIINTHSHHLSGEQFVGADLKFVLKNSYSSWMSAPPENKKQIRGYLSDNRCNSYFRWLFAGIEALYGLKMKEENYDEIDRRVREAHRDGLFHLSVLKCECGYERVLLDKYDDPGSDNGHPEIFTPVYRVNRFFFGYSRKTKDHNGNSPYDLPLFRNVKTLDDYLGAMREDIRRAKTRGAVALKNANAYERDLAYKKTMRRQAERAFLNSGATDTDIHEFQDYIAFELAQIALETNLPFQIHTGLGQLSGTSPIGLLQLIGEYPDVQFDLFHAGYPWTADMLGLMHNFLNVHVNLCWLPIISTREARDFIVRALEISSAKRIRWGSDTWTGEESLGSVLALRHVLSEALTEMIADGAIDTDEAKIIADRILRENAQELYNL